MKKLMKFLVFALIFVLMIPCMITGNIKVASAASGSTLNSFESFELTANIVLRNLKTYKSRVAGTDGELQVSKYIKNFLETETDLVARNDAVHVIDGVQKFSFESTFTGSYENSQNIIYTYTAEPSTDKKVILGTNYDAVAYKTDSMHLASDVIECESINGSAGSVALLLSIAKYISSWNLGFNVEIVFFGAGESNFAGAEFYTEGISDADKKDILAMINFDGVALGENQYFYVDEINNDLSKLVSSNIKSNKLDAKEVNIINLNKTNPLSNSMDLGLGYTHVALESNHLHFKKRGLNTINFFAGEYENGIEMGRTEFAGKDLIRFTENDNIAYIEQTYGVGVVEKNLYEVFKVVHSTLTDSSFVKVLKNGQLNSWFYTVFANESLALYLTAAAFILFVVIAMFVYYKLTVKAYYANVEVEFLSSVVKISEQIDDKGIDSNVPKAVSQLLAHDIKKDKTIKKDKKSKDDEEKK